MQSGVVNGNGMTGGGVFVHGARDRAWNYTLDGIYVNDSSQGGSNTTSFRVNPDMLGEFRVQTGKGTAEYGRNSAGRWQWSRGRAPTSSTATASGSTAHPD